MKLVVLALNYVCNAIVSPYAANCSFILLARIDVVNEIQVCYYSRLGSSGDCDELLMLLSELIIFLLWTHRPRIST